MNKYKGKYRIPSARAAWWDYGWNAPYFITICTHHRRHYFGDIRNGEMHLSEIGKIAHDCWTEIPQHFPFVQLGSHIIMPNHVHGIIIINKPNPAADQKDVQTQDIASQPTPPPNAADRRGWPDRQHPNTPKNRFGPQSQNLASIVRGYKTGVTKNARLIDPGFAWQARYHDHIIRDDRAYHNIDQYIQTNPIRWQNDKFYQ